MIITFIGHSRLILEKELSEKIRRTIRAEMLAEEKVSFYLGGYGIFDEHCASLCREIKKDLPSCEVVFVTPYITESAQERMKSLVDMNLYDGTIYPPIEKTPLRFAISKRNEWMISEADLVIAYVSHSFGGAYKSLKYAERKKKRIINLAK